MSQAIVLIDGNNFYASCEQSIDPSLLGQPLVVLSNNDGCIISRNAEARTLGIKMGTPYFKVRYELERLGVQVRSSNYALYGDMSQRLMAMIEANCKEVEIYSIDEAFALLDRPPNGNLYPWARQLRAQAHQNLGIPISIGIATNKCLAKIANHTAKKISSHAGIFDLGNKQNADIWLEKIAIEDVWGVGRNLAQWCRLQNVTTAKQLRDMPTGKLNAKHGVKAIRLQLELFGEVCLPIKTSPPPKKETRISRSFSRPISQLSELQEAIATYTVRGSEKLRQQNQVAGSITVFASSNPFRESSYNNSATGLLTTPSNDTNTLIKVAMKLTKEIFRPRSKFTKAGVVMNKLQTTKYQQNYFLTTYKKHKNNEQLMATIDRINNTYGTDTIRWAVCGKNPTWSTNQNQLSQSSTTCIKKIPLAKA